LPSSGASASHHCHTAQCFTPPAYLDTRLPPLTAPGISGCRAATISGPVAQPETGPLQRATLSIPWLHDH
jgi:hypothetical protein